MPDDPGPVCTVWLIEERFIASEIAVGKARHEPVADGVDELLAIVLHFLNAVGESGVVLIVKIASRRVVETVRGATLDVSVGGDVVQSTWKSQRLIVFDVRGDTVVDGILNAEHELISSGGRNGGAVDVGRDQAVAEKN